MVWFKLIQTMKVDNALSFMPSFLQGLCRAESSFSCPIRTEGVERMPSMTFSPLISKSGGGESIEIG